MSEVKTLVDHLFRRESGRMVSILTRLFGFHNLELVEDIVQDTLHQALLDWSLGNIPDNPPGWLMVVARRKAINMLKRERFIRNFAKDTDALLKSDWTASGTMDHVFLEAEIRDSQLRMIFTCCHPALPPEAQIALTLKTLCGLGTGEIANALLTSEANIQKRLYRAKEKIRNASIDFAVPSGSGLFERLEAVLLVIYLLFNEGYNSTGANLAIRKDLCLEAMRLAMLLIERPGFARFPQVFALLALMCLHAARFEARIDSNECLVILEEQDRALWDKDLIARGLAFLTRSAKGEEMTAYHLEAAIAAEHSLAVNFAETNWTKIYEYYRILEAVKPSPVIQLNMAIVTGKKDGPLAAIEKLHGLEKVKSLANYHLLYASLGEFYYQLGQKTIAQNYFLKAKTFSRSQPVNEVLDRKIALCGITLNS